MMPSYRVTVLLGLMAGPLAAQSPDLIVLNGNIYTAEAAQPRAQAMAVRDGRVMFVGTKAGAEALADSLTERLDLAGRTVIPGMIDAHGHLVTLGTLLTDVNLIGTHSFQEVLDRVVAAARDAPRGAWLRGRGWDQNDWPVQEFPTHDLLSAALPETPVVLERIDGHAFLINAAAMDRAGIDATRADTAGGSIVKDEDGNPTGILIDNAMDFVERVIPKKSKEQLKAITRAAMAELNRWGLTGLHDAGVGLDTIAAFEELGREGAWTIRNYVMVQGIDPGLDQFVASGPRSGLYGGTLWLRAIKLSADGALGSRGAALLADYSDDPGNRGLLLQPDSFLRRIAGLALANGFQLNVHAIGDRANRRVLDIYQEALAQRPTPDHRFRIEHAQILSAADIPRFAELGVIPSMQGSHQTSDMYWAPERLGYARSLGAYAWRSLRNTGVIIPNGSDLPVESPNPLVSFRAFITRRDPSGWPAGGWFPAERLTREEALLSITLWPAYAGFMEDVVGSLKVGKYADFVVLDRDIMTAPEDEILDAKVLRTVLGGRTVYRTDSD